MTTVVEWLAAQVPGGHLWEQLIRPTKQVGMAWCPRGPGRSTGLTPAAGAGGPDAGAARGHGWPGGQGLLCPPHADAAHVSVQVEEGTDAEGLRHDVAERWPLCRLQAEQTQDQLAQLRAVPVRDGRKGATHNL